MLPKRRNQGRGGSKVLPVALFAVLLGALGAVSWQVGWFGGGSGPLAVAQVPSALPARGVQLENGAIVLTPWTTTLGRAMSADQAIAAARHLPGSPGSRPPIPGLLAELHTALPATALKVKISLPGGWPPGSTAISDSRTIHSGPVWLVTFTSPKPIDASGGALVPFYVTQFSEALNPVTGKLVLGFETPFPCLHARPGSSLAACKNG